MSGSMAPDPPVRTAGPSHYLRFGLVMTIGLILASGAPHGLPGTGAQGSGKTITCRCGKVAGQRPDGKYVCADGDITEDPKKKKKAKGKGKN